MSKSSNQKLKLLYLLKILEEKTDNEHSITVPEIIKELEKYEIHAERKSVYDDIETLRKYGKDIICRKTKTFDYYLGSRDFELVELKLLADSVASSKFITEKKSRELIKKIGSLSSNYEASQLSRNIYVAGRVKTANEQIYYNVDKIHQAIDSKKQISFKYIMYTIEKKTIYKNNSLRYVVSPYALLWQDENYYLISYYDKYKDVTHFRVDKMEEIEVLELNTNDEITINVAQYTEKVFGMFGGKLEKVKILFDNAIVGVVIDRFGKDIIIYKHDENTFVANLEIELSPPFLGWLFQFGDKVKILSPDYVIINYKKYITDVLNVYTI